MEMIGRCVSGGGDGAAGGIGASVDAAIGAWVASAVGVVDSVGMGERVTVFLVGVDVRYDSVGT